MAKINQTAQKYLRTIRKSQIPVRGIGLFVIKTNGRLKKELFSSITYERAVILGKKSIAFKFIPYNVKIKIHDDIFLLRNRGSIPADKWVCSGKCSETEDCQSLSEVCICAEGECL